MRHEAWFVLPPVQEFYYRRDHPEYRTLPPYRADCARLIAAEDGARVMNLVYPEPDTSVYVPVELDGQMGQVVFEAVHRDEESVIHWHLDDRYVATTRHYHQISANPEPGDHVLVLTDGDGRRLERRFRVISPARRERLGREAAGLLARRSRFNGQTLRHRCREAFVDHLLVPQHHLRHARQHVLRELPACRQQLVG